MAEVVISMAILFFALTALIGLMGASTNMTASAKSKSVLTNVIASELENVRSLPYDQVALTTANPPGMIPPTKTVSKYGFNVVLSFSVTDRTATREVRVTAVATRAGFPDTRASSFAAVRDRIGGQTRQDEASGPVIEFTASTPPADSVLVGTNVYQGGTIVIGARATVDDANITTIEQMSVDTTNGLQPLRDNNTIYATPSQAHTFEPAAPTGEWTFAWDTRQVSQGGVPEVVDGRRTVTISALDDAGRRRSASRTFIVDNFPPTLPTNLLSTLQQNPDLTQGLGTAWTVALDGDNLNAPAHEMQLFRNTNEDADFAQWSKVGDYSQPLTLTVNPLSEYVFHVRGRSYSGRTTELYAASGVTVTRPVLTGYYGATYASKRWTYSNVLRIDPVSDFWSTIRIELVKTLVGGSGASSTTDITSAVLAAWATNTPYTQTDVWTSQELSGDSAIPPTYRLKVTLTPAGYGGGTSRVLYSNTVKAPSLAKNQTPGTQYTVWW